MPDKSMEKFRVSIWVTILIAMVSALASGAIADRAASNKADDVARELVEHRITEGHPLVSQAIQDIKDDVREIRTDIKEIKNDLKYREPIVSN